MDLVDFPQMVLLNDVGGFSGAIVPTELKLGVCQGYEFLVMEYEQGGVIAVNVIGVGVLGGEVGGAVAQLGEGEGHAAEGRQRSATAGENTE